MKACRDLPAEGERRLKMTAFLPFAWNIDFNLAALVIFIIMLFILFATGNRISWQDRIFRRTIIASIAACVMEIFLSNACLTWGKTYTGVLVVFIVLDELMITAVTLFFCLNFISMTQTRQAFRRQWYWILVGPFLAACFVLLVFGRGFYSVLEENGTVRIFCSQAWITFTVRFLYVALSLVFAIRYFRQLDLIQRVASFLFVLLMAMSLIYSFLTGDRILTMFETAMPAMLMFVTLQNPLAYHDPYTKAGNEKAFHDIAKSLMEDGRAFSVITIHPEGFSGISGAIGRENGDKVLETVANYLLSLNKEAYVFHLIGTKFAMLLKGEGDPSETVAAVRSRFDSPFRIERLEVPLTAVITCLRFPQDVDSMDELSQSMDYALKVEVGRTESRVFYGRDFSEKLKRSESVLRTLRQAIEESTIEVFYQPIYSTEKKRYTSAEALARLPDGKGGYIAPGEFIPLAEQEGDILKLGEMVLQMVCSFIAMSHPQDYGIETVNVNLSAIQCMQEHMADRLISIIDANQIPHSMITFEITESVAAVSSDKTGELIGKLMSEGIRFALDDYGTGYSNAGNLLAYDYSVVKIDKSIVWAAQRNEKSLLTLKFITMLINELKIEPLAEGIETQEQADLMDSIGCHHFQGFLYSMPVPGGKFMQIISYVKAGL